MTPCEPKIAQFGPMFLKEFRNICNMGGVLKLFARIDRAQGLGVYMNSTNV